MDNAFLTAGVACLIGAIVGGGLKAFGIELPVIQSRVRQVGLALAGVVLIALARPTLPLVQVAEPTMPRPSAEPTAASLNAPRPVTVSSPPTSATYAPSPATITLDGPPVPVQTTGPGLHRRLTFDGRSNQAVSILLANPDLSQPTGTEPGCDSAHVQLFAPGEQSLAGVRGCSPILGRQLPVDGLYLIDVWSDQAAPAVFSVRLYDASPQAGQITLDGPPVAVRTIAPGQHVRLAFAGQANLMVSATVRDPSLQSVGDSSLGCDGARMDLVAPGGQPLGGVARCSPLPGTRLAVDGTYTLDFSTSQELPSDFVIQLFGV